MSTTSTRAPRINQVSSQEFIVLLNLLQLNCHEDLRTTTAKRLQRFYTHHQRRNRACAFLPILFVEQPPINVISRHPTTAPCNANHICTTQASKIWQDAPDGTSRIFTAGSRHRNKVQHQQALVVERFQYALLPSTMRTPPNIYIANASATPLPSKNQI